MVRAGPQTIAKPIGQGLPWMGRIQPPFVRGEALNPSKCEGEFRLVVAESRARGYPDALGNSFGRELSIADVSKFLSCAMGKGIVDRLKLSSAATNPFTRA